MSKNADIFQIVVSELDFYIITRVKEIRRQQNISQVELSLSMGLAAGAISKIENPRQRAKYNIRHLNLLAKALHCLPSDLLPTTPLADKIRIHFRINKDRTKSSEEYYEIIKIEIL